jgi:hypothetical protein
MAVRVEAALAGTIGPQEVGCGGCLDGEALGPIVN